HPGDQYSYDIFSQIASAIRRGRLIPGDLEAATLVATGGSQSAMFLVTYVNAIDRLHQLFDGYLLAGRLAWPVPLAGFVDPAALRDGREAVSIDREALGRLPAAVPVRSDT